MFGMGSFGKGMQRLGIEGECAGGGALSLLWWRWRWRLTAFAFAFRFIRALALYSAALSSFCWIFRYIFSIFLCIFGGY